MVGQAVEPYRVGEDVLVFTKCGEPWLHWPNTRTGTPLEESWGTMAELADEGKVRWIGVCNFGPDLLERIEPIRHVDSVQPRTACSTPRHPRT